MSIPPNLLTDGLFPGIHSQTAPPNTALVNADQNTIITRLMQQATIHVNEKIDLLEENDRINDKK